jgi:hypothetical protein
VLGNGGVCAHRLHKNNLVGVDVHGGLLQYVTTAPGNSYIVNCHDNYLFSRGGTFNPGLYDIVAGATASSIATKFLCDG